MTLRERVRSIFVTARGGGLIGPLAIVLAVWLAWLIVRVAVVQNAPVAIAVRIAPDSPSVLSRAAEAEFAAGRVENAAVLARQSLGRSPFDVRALRVVGLTEARRGSVARADQILTLAGNWSLRDDPSHAWLVEQRLRQGDYGSALAHADTILRRRRDLDESIFGLITTAATLDPRGLRASAALLRQFPPWRKLYLESALRSPEGRVAVTNLAVLLQPTPGKFTELELEALYMALITDKRTGTVRALADRLGRPRPGKLRNGGFEGPSTSRPFNWILKASEGVIAEVVQDDADPERMALRVEYDGRTNQRAADQALLLSPGSYMLTGSVKSEDAGRTGGLQWIVTCLETGRAVSSTQQQQGTAAFTWLRFTLKIDIPAHGCSMQWLTLLAIPAERTGTTVSWFDDMEIHQ